MPAYRIRETGRYLPSYDDLRQAFPDSFIPPVLSQDDQDHLGVDEVHPTAPPAVDRLHRAAEGAPELVAGQWVQTWTVIDITAGMTAEEITALKLDLCAELAAACDAERDATIAGGFRFDFTAYEVMTGEAGAVAQPAANFGDPAGTLTLQMGLDDQTNWLGRVLLAQSAVAAGTGAQIMPLRTLENVNVQTTAAQVLEILPAAAAWKDEQVFACSARKDALRAMAVDPARTPGDMLALLAAQ